MLLAVVASTNVGIGAAGNGIEAPEMHEVSHARVAGRAHQVGRALVVDSTVTHGLGLLEIGDHGGQMHDRSRPSWPPPGSRDPRGRPRPIRSLQGGRAAWIRAATGSEDGRPARPVGLPGADQYSR